MRPGTIATSIEFGEADAEGSFGGRRIEGFALKHRRLNLRERHAHRIDERKRPRRGPHAVGAARQELVAEQRPEPPEIVTHRRLAETDARRGARDAPLGEQRIEGDQQVEVEPTQISVVDTGH